jgi:hypothetical protein
MEIVLKVSKRKNSILLLIVDKEVVKALNSKLAIGDRIVVDVKCINKIQKSVDAIPVK